MMVEDAHPRCFKKRRYLPLQRMRQWKRASENGNAILGILLTGTFFKRFGKFDRDYEFI
jgi:hypothetical protein